MRNELPDMCYFSTQVKKELAVIKKGETGYFPYNGCDTKKEAQELADLYNKRLGLSPAQVEAMVCGSMFGWDKPVANPQTFLDRAILVETIHAKGHLKDPIISLYSPFEGNLLHYKVAKKDAYYLDLAAITSTNDYYIHQCGCILLPDLVAGRPLLPINVSKGSNGSYSLTLEDNCFVTSLEVNANYKIVCRVNVGEVEFVLAYHPSINVPTPYATWERTPGNERENDLPHYYWGHYLPNCKTGLKDFVERIMEKYRFQKEHNLR